MLEEYSKFCYKIAGGAGLVLESYFNSLKPKLTEAGLDIPLSEYLSMVIFTIGLMAVVNLVSASFVFLFVSSSSLLLASLLGLALMPLLTLILFYTYPFILIKQRSAKIRDDLPFATIYLSTLAGSGTSVPEMFKNIGDVNEYGEVSKEARKISRDIETFGMDITEALGRSADRTPSQEYRELMRGMNHTITTGGSLTKFLNQRSKTLMGQYKRAIEEYSEKLSIIVEIYITLVIVGSIIFTSMSAVMSSISQSLSYSQVVGVQIFAIFIVLPGISLIFIILVRGLAPGGIR